MLTLCAGLAIGCTPRAPPERRLTVFVTAEVRGALEPCGCESDPLGDAARFAALVRAAPGAVVVDGGDRHYESAERREQDEPKARLIERIWSLLGRVDEPPAPIVLAGGREAARALARRGPWIVVQTKGVGEGTPDPERVGPGWVVAPADRLRRVGVIELVLRGGTIADAGSPERLARRAAQLESLLAGWREETPFVAARRAEAAKLRADAARWRPPRAGSAFTWRLVSLDRSRPRDAQVAAEMRALDFDIARINRARAEREAEGQPAPLRAGVAGYVGSDACARCHGAAHALWRATPHGRAFATLVSAGKEWNESCVPCHVTGFGKPGGATIAAARALRDVGCENCHGPASLHVADDGLDDPPTLRRAVPEAVCRGCHNPQHSDTFAYEPYLRDVLATDEARAHGAALRARIGDGPTGAELRRAALEKAGAAH